ncbi:MSC_0623 family F1-like ATPase-associated protein [Mycoplasmopsis gallinacea]|uniref:Protein of uncharacterized function (DUF2714) n=1 Tax=Mycoplasmopsis gallinacea TaxID=29556 RepID=A0A449A416_9BACT|nr:DUF2714 domain-containing protein [Mycoplasmopsis gallinacea]VEU58913.1 Protein of uncharacterised function (DUF2714) [Mycoplasmopsis gallinacea]
MPIFKRKTKTLAPEVQAYHDMIFKNYHNAKADKFISNEAFINQVLIIANLNKKDELWKKYYHQGYEQFINKNEIRFKNFVLTYERDLRFDLNNLVPTIKNVTNPKVITFNFANSDLEAEAALLECFNKVLVSFLEQGYNVEIFPDVILTFDKNLDKLTVLFSENFVTDAHQEN